MIRSLRERKKDLLACISKVGSCVREEKSKSIKNGERERERTPPEKPVGVK